MPSSSPISSVNDFVVRLANVNGSAPPAPTSCSRARCWRMGVAVAPRNIFLQHPGPADPVRGAHLEAGHPGARGGTWT